MTDRSEWKNKRILVLGMGRSGIASARALSSLGAEVLAVDSKQNAIIDPEILKDFEDRGISCHFGRMPALEGVDMMIISPGVPLTEPFVQETLGSNVEVIGELELAYRLADEGTFLAITGTNGKTTTTTLVGEIVKAAGVPCEVVGNIGVAAVERAAAAPKGTCFVTEVSSFQLESIREFKPKVAALLNVTPDHLDRHKTMENYGAAKARIFENQDSDGYSVVNFDDKLALSLSTSSAATVVPFSRLEEMKFGACLMGDDLVVINSEEEVIRICRQDELKIPGDHNLENALAAIAITYFAGIDPAVIAKAVREFGGVEHRIEDCGTVNGVRYFNDSKGTNPDAAIKAINAMKSDTIIIAGGYDKDADFTEFIQAFPGKVYCAILIGKTAVKIKETAENLGFTNTIMVEDMEQAVTEAARLAKEGDSILLSPACASWDMYNSFEERGDHFKSCVEALRKG